MAYIINEEKSLKFGNLVTFLVSLVKYQMQK